MTYKQIKGNVCIIVAPWELVEQVGDEAPHNGRQSI